MLPPHGEWRPGDRGERAPGCLPRPRAVRYSPQARHAQYAEVQCTVDDGQATPRRAGCLPRCKVAVSKSDGRSIANSVRHARVAAGPVPPMRPVACRATTGVKTAAQQARGRRRRCGHATAGVRQCRARRGEGMAALRPPPRSGWVPWGRPSHEGRVALRGELPARYREGETAPTRVTSPDRGVSISAIGAVFKIRRYRT